MAKYINKDALVAEIERRSKEAYGTEWGWAVQCATYAEIISLLDTFEVKEVEESTAADRGVAEEIIINLKRVEQDYHIDLTNEMEWIRNKSQKGVIV